MLPEDLNVYRHFCGSEESKLSRFWIFPFFIISIYLTLDDPKFCYTMPNAQWGRTSCNCINGHHTKRMNKSCLFLMFEHNNGPVYICAAIIFFSYTST